MPESFARFRRSHEFWLLMVIAALVVFLSIATDSFLTFQNLFDLLTSYAFLGILAAGLLVVLISGGIDISFTATASIAQYVTMLLANRYGLDWFTVFALATTVGIACGAINAVLVDRLNISSIIVTIATLNIFFGLLVFVTGGKYIYSLPDWFSKGIYWFEYIDANEISYGINLQILALVVMFALTWLILNRTNIGRQIYALGGNRDAHDCASSAAIALEASKTPASSASLATAFGARVVFSLDIRSKASSQRVRKLAEASASLTSAA